MIAILGASGYIGRSLARKLSSETSVEIVLYSRTPSTLRGASSTRVIVKHLADFEAGQFSLVINAIGAGDPAKVKALGDEIVSVTDTWDQCVLNTMRPDAHYVFLSSGAVHTPFRDDAIPPYVKGKLAAERGHRALADRAILDIRIFGYTDQTIPLNGTFFLADLARSVVTGTPLQTTSDDMIRDYVGPDELWQFIECWRHAGAPNVALDIYSRAPVAKSALIQQAVSQFGITISYSELVTHSPTGTKNHYASSDHAAATLGYNPSHGSLDLVMSMLTTLKANSKAETTTSIS